MHDCCARPCAPITCNYRAPITCRYIAAASAGDCWIIKGVHRRLERATKIRGVEATAESLYVREGHPAEHGVGGVWIFLRLRCEELP